MAFKSFLSRASSSIAPLSMSIRSAGTHAVSRGVISSVDKGQLIDRQLIQFSRFSTFNCKDIVRLIESDHSGYKFFDMIHIPDEYPFEIEDHGDSLLLERKYDDERIQVIVEVNKYEVKDDEPTVPMVAYVCRGGRQELSFCMTTKPDLIEIHSCKVRDIIGSHMPAVDKYLEVRGFSPIMSQLIGRQLVPFSQFSETTGDNLNRLKQFADVLDGFPFKIEDYHEGRLILKRQFEDEIIECQATIPGEQGQMRMNIQVLKGDLTVEFGVSYYPKSDQLRQSIKFMRMSKETGNLDEFRNFLEIRGIKASNTNYLFYYVKKQLEHIYGSEAGVKIDTVCCC